jgi:predicted Zn finger-like uncharacterized protein
MQFICESCKANLQIADEKVRGKRLIVRCKRCGVQIRIVDPALTAQPGTSAAAAAGADVAARPATRTPTPTGPIARAPAPGRPSDTESTRAMESEVLEKALRASKTADAPAAAPRSAPPPPPPRETPAPRDVASWFAMIQGKQVGPMTHAEVALKATAGQIGPRTYLWKEGMEAWIRAKEVPELVPLFAAPPVPPPAPGDEMVTRDRKLGSERVGLPFDSGSGRNTPPGSGPVEVEAEQVSPDAPTPPGGMRAAVAETPAALPGEERASPPLPGALDLARWGAAELSKPRPETPVPSPKVAAAPARDFGAARRERRSPVRLLLAVLAFAAAGGLLAFVLVYGREGRGPEPVAQTARPPEPAQADPGAREVAEEKNAAPAPHEATGPAPALSPEDLKRKVDENRPALQGCVDEAVKRDPSLRAAKILISTTIAPSGAVTSARIEQKSVDQSPLGTCLKSAARKMQFPAFTGEAFAVDIPIVVTGGE